MKNNVKIKSLKQNTSSPQKNPSKCIGYSRCMHYTFADDIVAMRYYMTFEFALVLERENVEITVMFVKVL